MSDIVVNAEVKSNIGQLTKELDDAKSGAKNLGGALSGAAGALAAVQGTMKLFGKESEKTEKSILKVQAAMTISTGVRNLADGAKNVIALTKAVGQWNIVQKAAAAAQYAWNLAMSLNPLGAILAAITAVIAAGAALINFFKSSAKQAREMNDAVEKNATALDKQTKALERNKLEFEKRNKQELEMLKASGASAEAIRELELKLIDETIAFDENQRAIAAATVSQNENTLAKLKAADADEELIEKQQELTEDSIDELERLDKQVTKSLDARTDIENRHLVEIQKLKTDAAKKARQKAIDDAKKEADMQKDINEKRLQAERDLQQELIDLEIDRQNQQTINAAELIDQFNENALEEIDRERNKVYDKYFAIIEAEEEGSETRLQLEKNLAAEIKKIDADHLHQVKIDGKKETDLKRDNLNEQVAAFGDLAGALGSLAGDNKELAAASAIIDTFVGANKAFAQGGVAGFATGAAVVAAGLANVQKIYSTPVGGSSGGGGGASASPPAPQMMSGAFELGSGLEPEPTRAYVVTDEMTNSQNQLANIRRRATI